MANAPVTPIAVTTAAERQRVRCSDRPDSRQEAPSRAAIAVDAVIASGEARHIPASTPTPPSTATSAKRSPSFPLDPSAAAVATARRNNPLAKQITPAPIVRALTGRIRRRPARADSTEVVARLRAGSSAAIVAAAMPVTNRTAMSTGAMVVMVQLRLTMRSITGVPARNTTMPTPIPRVAPTAPDHVPCSDSVRRIRLGEAPLAASWPTVASWRRALVANAAAMITPSAASDSTPATHPHANAWLSLPVEKCVPGPYQ